jgi:glycosyltransferase involved in cell wall biosynthesis
MKNIAFINTVFEEGGAAKIAQELFRMLKNKYPENIYFFYGRGRVVKEKNIIKFGYNWETVLHVIFVRFLGLDGFGSWFSTKKLIKLLRKNNINIVHLHNVHGYYVNFPLLFSFFKKNNIKVIWTLHDEWVLTSLRAHSGGCTHCVKGKGKCRSEYLYPRAFINFFERYVLRKKHNSFSYQNITFVSPASWLYEKLKKSYLYSNNIKLVENGIKDFNFSFDKNFLKTKYNISENKFLILFLDSFNKNKNRKDVIDIMDNFPDCIFVGIGGEEKQYKNYIGFGFVHDKEKLSEIFSMCDLFCYTSQYETLPTVVLEGMACGLPILGYDKPFMKDIILRGNCGLLVPSREKNGLIKAITLLRFNTDLLEKFSKNAKQEIKERYSFDLMCEKYLAVYNKIKHEN